MKSLVIERHVAAPPERTFDVFSNVQGAKDTLSAVTRIEMLSPGAVAKGTRWRETRVMFGREATEEMWIDSFEPPRGYSVAAQSGGARYLTTFTFAPKGGGTDVRMEFSAVPANLVAKVLGGLMGPLMAGSMRKALEKDMDELKAAAERPCVVA